VLLLLAGLLFWGSGVWWLLMATLLTAAAQRRGLLPFALSWWGFTFPLGAFAAASLRLGGATGLAGVEWIGIACWGLLLDSSGWRRWREPSAALPAAASSARIPEPERGDVG
jgi:tellurite resistance protein TehA-like permease